MSVCLLRVEGPEGDGKVQGRGLGDPSDPGVHVSLPVVLGRGSLLKCAEKRVSRRHAYLDWEDKGVLLTAVHQSPTYVVVGDGALQEVGEGTSVLLSHGDKFGFLRDKFWYMLDFPSALINEEELSRPSVKEEEEAKGEERNEVKEEQGEARSEEKKDHTNDRLKVIKEENHEAVNGDTPQQASTKRMDTPDEETHDGRKGKPKAVMADPEPQQAHQGPQSTEGGTDQQHNSSPASSSTPSITIPSGAPSPNTVTGQVMSAIGTRERNLPLWLQHTSSGTSVTPTPPTPATPRSHQSNRRAQATSSRTLAKLPADSDPSQTELDLFSLDAASNRRQEESPQRQQNSKVAHRSPQQWNQSSPVKRGGGIHHQMSDDSDGEEGAAASTTTTTTTIAASPSITPGQITKSEAKDNVKEEAGEGSNNSPRGASPQIAPPIASTGSSSSRSTRPSCQYGATCYRKNPAHRQQEAHPGDPDYHSPGDGDSDGDGDDRPHCEYGVDCYRRNPQHRRDFKHSRIPQPQRRAKRKARQQKGRQATGGEGSNDNDYDLDDPFLYDGSSDDYAPTDDSSESGLEPSQDGEEEEDTKRMLKEGRKFVKKRK